MKFVWVKPKLTPFEKKKWTHSRVCKMFQLFSELLWIYHVTHLIQIGFDVFLPFYRGSWNFSGFRTRKRIILLIAIKQGDLINLFETLTLSWRWSLSYRKYSNDLQTSFFLAREYERFLRNNTFSFNKHNFIITATSLFIIQVKLEVTKILDSVFNVNQTFIQCITA